MIVISLLVAAALGSTTAVEYAFTTATPGGGETINLDIALIDNNTMITYPGTPVPPQDCFKQSVNLHDFERGLVAIKIVDVDSCYIKPSTETYEEVRLLIDAINAGTSGPIQQDTEEWVIPSIPISEDEVEDRVGENIAGFCHGYTVYAMSDLIRSIKAVPRIARDLTGLGRETRKFKGWCVFCRSCKVSSRR